MMDMQLNLIILGTAGSGKSALTATFSKWLKRNTDQDVVCVNLDPGCDFVPFEPEFDIRRYFTIAQIMREEKLGPNGAMIRASELFGQKVKDFSNEINKIETEIKLIDTPGQMEIFLFHGGPEFVKFISGTTISIFLIDAEIAIRAAGLVFARLLELSIGFRLGSPTITALNKIDLVRSGLEDIDYMLANPELFGESITKESSGVMTDLASELSKTLPKFLPAARLVKVSAKTGAGMQELYDIVHEVFCVCGDLT